MHKTTSTNRLLSFWPLQAGGWLGYALIMELSLLPLGQGKGLAPSYAALVGGEFLSSFLLYWLCHVLWKKSIALLPSLTLCVAASYPLATLSAVPAVWFQLEAQHDSAAIWNHAIASGVGAAFTLIAWCALYFGIKHYLTVENQKILLLQSEATARAAQMQALQYQLQPHFLFNTLNAISSLVVSEQGAKATEMLSKLATLLRSTLEQPNVYSISLDQELAVVAEYLDIEKVRFGTRLQITHDIQWEVRSAAVPRFLLQPIVENAVRHGIARRIQGGALGIQAHLIANQVHIEIFNDTGDSSHDDSQPSHGLGLSNSRARLEKLYGDRATLTTTLAEHCFLVAMVLPFEPIGSTPVLRNPE